MSVGRGGSGSRLPVSHVGVTVPEIYPAIDWYTEVLGMVHIMGPRLLTGGNAETASIFGDQFRRAYQAHLLAGNEVGLELFQPVDPPVENADREIHYLRRGQWHLCLTVDDIGATLADVLDHGGQRMSPVSDFVPGRPYQLVYFRDPFGITWELMSDPYAQVFSDWPQPGAASATTWLARDGSTYIGEPPTAAEPRG